MQPNFRLPLFRILLWFIAGVCLAETETPCPVHTLTIVMGFLSCVLGLLAMVLFRVPGYSFRWIPGVVIAAFYLVSGYTLQRSFLPAEQTGHISRETGPVDQCLIRIDEPPQTGERSIRCKASMVAVYSDSQWKRSTGKIMIYQGKDTTQPRLAYGDTLLVKSAPVPVRPPANPHQFDYRRYLECRQIRDQVFLKGNNYTVTGKSSQKGILCFAYQFRENLQHILRQSVGNEQECAIAQAILLGDKSQLDDETYQSFSSSGTIHILCVSGLHVGIIYLVLHFLVGFLPHHRWANLLRTAVIIAMIWAYALLTGLTPSVLRASVMFSIVSIGQSQRRPTSIYATLAASALLLIAARPGILYETGFQLSYLAVIGIVTLQPWISNLVTFKHGLPSRIWALLSVSAAAQLFTFPLTIHLFHQFPNYFLLANLLVVPLAGLVIYAGILVFLTHSLPFIGNITSFVFTLLVRVMNRIVGFVENLPCSTTTGLSLDAVEVVLVYTIVVTGLFVMVWNKKRAVFLLMGSLLFLEVYKLGMLYKRLQEDQMIVYAIPGSTALGFIDGRHGVFFMDSLLMKDTGRIQTRMGEHWIHSRLKKLEKYPLSPSGPVGNNWFKGYQARDFSYFSFKGRQLLMIRHYPEHAKDVPQRLRIDYALLSGSVTVDLGHLARQMDLSCILFDQSNTRRKVNQWKLQVKALNLTCYDMAEQGAYVERW